MKGMRRGILSMAVLLIAGTAAAQSAPVDLAVTYDALHANHINSQNFWMQGGAIELGAQFYRGLGIVARVEGDHAGTGTTTGEPLSLVTTVFGPRYTMETRSHRYAIFGEGLVGISAVWFRSHRAARWAKFRHCPEMEMLPGTVQLCGADVRGNGTMVEKIVRCAARKHNSAK